MSIGTDTVRGKDNSEPLHGVYPTLALALQVLTVISSDTI